jgi:O-antigen/teichoic acid export membrane protein
VQVPECVTRVDDSQTGSVKHASATRAVLWVLGARQGERLLGLVSIAILARLLSPADFGLVAMAGAVVAVVEVISAFGFDWALVRLAQPTREHYDTAWTLRVLCGLLICGVLVAAADPMAILYGRPAVAAIVIAMGLNSVIGSAENIWMAEFRRASRFEPEFRLRMGSKVVGFLVAVGWALATHSYWALVLGVTASRVAASLLSYRLHRSRPRWDLSRWAELLRFSIWLLVGALTETLRSRFADMWLGRNLGATSVGFYSLASELSILATTELVAPVNRAMFAKYSQQSGDIPALRQAYMKISGVIWLVGFPAATGIGVCAAQIVALLLGGQWGDAVPVLQILAAAGLLGIVGANTQYVYWALGRSRFVTLLSIVEGSGFVLLTILLGSKYGLVGVALAQVLASVLVVSTNMFVLFRTLSISPIELLARNRRVILATATMAVCVLMVDSWLGARPAGNPGIELAVKSSAGAVCYFVTLFLLWTASGRPSGPENDFVQTALGGWRQLAEQTS